MYTCASGFIASQSEARAFSHWTPPEREGQPRAWPWERGSRAWSHPGLRTALRGRRAGLVLLLRSLSPRPHCREQQKQQEHAASNSLASQTGQGGLRGGGQEALASVACGWGHRAAWPPFLLQIRAWDRRHLLSRNPRTVGRSLMGTSITSAGKQDHARSGHAETLRVPGQLPALAPAWPAVSVCPADGSVGSRCHSGARAAGPSVPG